MRLRTPSFWYDTVSPEARATAAAFSALSALYGFGHALHQRSIITRSAGIPVLCIGNLVAGGSGKTPTALAVMTLIKSSGLAKNPCFLSRGYGGSLSGPVRVDNHTAAEVGDEPLLLAALAPTIVSADRFKGAEFARQTGHDLVVMDDGLQNPGLKKNLSIVVIDGTSGFGNGLLLPAGPLRTPLHKGLAKADAVLLIGDDLHNVLARVPHDKLILRAHLTPVPPKNAAANWHGFCGLGQPEKFRRTLLQAGLNLTGFKTFPDHYPYTLRDLENLRKEADAAGARLITTAKDAVRLPRDHGFDIMGLTLDWDGKSKTTLARLIKTML